ncbi:MAG TPA: dephospho-CoA kinase [Acidimicrobiales bacterium]|nr:dephospho-CoA kinase [Acidimicrobiales bacterium]
MKRIVVAGGIGAGKSVVAERLRALGFDVVDADDVAHQITSPGSATLSVLVDAFGTAVLDQEGAFDRAFIAEVVFHDPTALRRLNAITHGPIGVEIARRLDEAEGDAVFAAVPLFRPEHRAAFSLDAVWAVEATPQTAIRRLVDGRGFSDADARSRLANQMSNEERTAIVDRVLWNEGSLDDLYAELDRALDDEGLSRG